MCIRWKYENRARICKEVFSHSMFQHNFFLLFQILGMGKAASSRWPFFWIFVFLQPSSAAHSPPYNISTRVEVLFQGTQSDIWHSHLITASNSNKTISSQIGSGSVELEKLPHKEHSVTFQINFAAKAAAMMTTERTDNTTRYRT